MRKFLAIVACKILRFVGKLVGKGSSLPGKYALKICPDILRRVELPKHIIAVTGSNGKTSTVEMIAAILRADGKTVVYNEEGSNQIEGVTTLVLSHATLGGKVNADVLLIECERPKSAPDEQEARKRIRFYTKAGAVLTSVRVWLFGVEYSIMVLPCDTVVPKKDWAGQMLQMYRQMLPKALYDANVRLIRE